MRAFESLVRRHQDLAYRTACLITGSTADAEDATQEGLVKAWYALDRFRSDAPFRPWLLTIVANEARNRRRSGRRQDDLTMRVAEARPSGDAAPSPEAAALAGERRRTLLRAVAGMPERDRLVIAARFFLELSERETAEVLACRPGTVKSRMSRALARLRLALEDQDGRTQPLPAQGGGGST